MTKRVLFIGDSCTAGIGVGADVYPYLLHAARHRPAGDYLNLASPGFTTADAVALITDLHGEGALTASTTIVLYLGNNEQAPGKRAPDAMTLGLRRWLTRSGWRNHGGRLPPDGGPYHFLITPKSLPAPIPVAEVVHNLRRVLSVAQRAGCRVLAVLPVANDAFPRGCALPNAAWFLRVGCCGTVSPLLPDEGDERVRILKRALELAEAGDPAGAVTALHPLAPRSGQDAVDVVAAHNLAVLTSTLGDPRTAIDRLMQLADGATGYAPIHLEDAGRLAQASGQPDFGDECLRRSYEVDYTAYQIKPAVRAAFAAEFARAGVDVIDLEPLTRGVPQPFIDYCHPTRALHQALADEMATRLTPDAEAAAGSYSIVPPSPDLARRPEARLMDYYQIDRRDAAPAAFPPELLERARRADARHPLLARAAGPPREQWFEVLSFPEYHIARLMLGCLPDFERHCPDLAARLAALPSSPFTADAIDQMILRFNPSPIAALVPRDESFADAALAAAEAALAKSSLRLFDGEARLRTILGWYNREAFRYGTHSRPGMLYDRWHLETILEALVAAAAIYGEHGNAANLVRARTHIENVLGVIEAAEARFTGGIPDSQERNMWVHTLRSTDRIRHCAE